MLLGEPPRTQADLNFSLFGFPIRVHPLFWLVSLLLGYGLGDPASVLTWIVAVFVSILAHELGHAAAMRAYGLHPWIVLYGMGGLTSYDTRYAGHSKGSGTLGQILISDAGPVAGFLLAALLVVGLILAGHGQDLEWGLGGLMPHVFLQNARIAFLFNVMFFIGIIWGLVNLLPIYPLDGGQIAREILLRFSPRDGIRQSLFLSMFAAGAVAVFMCSRQMWITGMFFGYLAYSSYATLEAYRNRGPW